MYNPQIANKMQYAVKSMEDELAKRSLSFSNSVELFLQLSEFGEDDDDEWSYYFIDHSSRTQFWIDHIAADVLDVPAVASPSHLKLALEEHYWHHVSNFPMHFGGLRQELLEELIAIFSHGQADRMTSKVSTFLYSSDECAKFLELLRSARCNLPDGHTTCFVARLWSFVVGNRVNTHYGQRQARLSRDQAILNESYSGTHWTFDFVSRFLFAIPGSYLSKLDNVYVDDLVYADQWRDFMRACRDDWKSSLSWAFPILISNVLLLLAPKTSPAMTIATVILCGMSILSGMLLLTRHEGLGDASTSVALDYLRTIRSMTFGFHRASLAYSLPKAMSLWSTILFLFHCIFIAARIAGLNTPCAYAPVVVPAALLFFFGSIWRYTPENSYVSSLASCFYSSDTSAESPV